MDELTKAAIRQDLAHVDIMAWAIPRDVESGDDLELLNHLGVAGRAIERLKEAAAFHAREHGATWTQVGNVLGITRQAAQQRYGK